MKAKLQIHGHSYVLIHESKNIAFAHTEDFSSNDTIGKLSLKNCQAIENGYDLEELAHDVNYGRQNFGNVLYDIRNAFKQGFQKALELLGNKKFDEKDMISAYNQGGNDGASYESACGDYDSYEQIKEARQESEQSEKEFIQSLQQTEWDVEVEMEIVTDFNSRPEIDGQVFSTNKKSLPKKDSEGCLILKLI